MKINSNNKKTLRVFSWIAPFLFIFGMLINYNVNKDKAEYSEDFTFFLFSIIIMLINSVVLLILFVSDKQEIPKLKYKLLNGFSILFGTPVFILLYLIYFNTLMMNLDFAETKYLRDDCFTKWQNIYLSENRYNFTSGYCNNATQDSIIVTEVYRWGSIKNCGVIMNGVYKEIEADNINFLTENQKKEILSY